MHLMLLLVTTLSATPTVKFAALGDTGKGNKGQRIVGEALRNFCAEHGCDLVVLLGDNIYESGVSSVEDPQWQEKFEQPYQDINAPFYAVLGNHDYGAHGHGSDFARALFEVAYTRHSKRWKMPATHYTFTHGPAGFVALDTNSLMFNSTLHGNQSTWIDGALSGLKTKWKFVLGHHPYLSNGPHGNAGAYDSDVGDGVNTGKTVKEFFDAHVCDHADFYLAGHDHSRQWLEKGCGMELVVSGNGAAPSTLPGHNRALWQSTGLGFAYFVVTPTQVTGQFIGTDGAVEFERVVKHR